MKSLSKKFVLMLMFILTVSCLLLVTPCVAPVTMPANPSVAPDIVSVVFHHNPLWQPPTYTTNPYTGEVTETSSGYWRPNGTLEITIKNRPFTPYVDKDGNYINVYYSFFRRASHIVMPWDIMTRPSSVVYQSISDYTVFILRYDDSFSSGSDILSVGREGSNFDFRVQAVTGYFQGKFPYLDATFEGEGSEWTEFTIEIPVTNKPSTSTPSISSNPSTPSTSNSNNTPPQNTPQPNPFWTNIIILIIFIAIIVILLAVITYQHKQRKASLPTETDVFSCEVKTECLNKNKPCFTCCAAGVG